MNWKERIILLILAALNFTHILDFMIMMPLGNYLMPYFDISAQQFSFLVAAYTISAAVSGFVAAFYVDGFDRRKVLLFGYSGFIIGTIACGFAPNYGFLLAFRLLAGLFGGLIGAQVLSIISDIYSYERRGRAMGAIMSAFAVASTLGIPLALYLSNIFSWHAPFLFIGGLGLLIIPLIIYFIPPMSDHLRKSGEENAKDEKPGNLQVLTTVWNDNRQRMALMFSGLIMVGHFMIIPFINPYMEFNNGYPKNVTPMIYLVGGISSFVAANLLGWIADRYGKLRVFIACVFLSMVLVYAITNVPAIPFTVILTMFGCWFAFSTGRGVTAQAMVSNVVEPEKRGSFMSFNSSLQQLGSSVAALVSGLVVIRNPSGRIEHYDLLGYLSIAVLMVCAWLAWKIFGRSELKKKASLAVAADRKEG